MSIAPAAGKPGWHATPTPYRKARIRTIGTPTGLVNGSDISCSQVHSSPDRLPSSRSVPPRQVPAAYELAGDGGVAADESKEDPWRCRYWLVRLAAAVGGLLVLTTGVSVVATLIVPRPVGGWLTSWARPLVARTFQFLTSGIADYRKRDRLRDGEAASILIAQLIGWLGADVVGFALLFWPFISGGFAAALTLAGSSLFTLGFAAPPSGAPGSSSPSRPRPGLIIVSLQIAYLPTLYGAFNRRETEVALLNARSGVPSWGPELLARTHYALGSGVSTLDTLPDLYARWERWAADVAESHSAYPPLVRFRSPRPLSSWVTALLAMLDSAALILALSPQSAPVVPARLFLRSGFLCFN